MEDRTCFREAVGVHGAKCNSALELIDIQIKHVMCSAQDLSALILRRIAPALVAAFALTPGAARPATPQVAASLGNSAALKSDGTVWAWGDNEYGQLGNGNTVNSSAPVQVSGLGNVAAIAIGERHVVTLKTDGTVWTWGSNEFFGQLGSSEGDGSLVPVRVAGPTKVVAISSTYMHTVALTSDGMVWTWGSSGSNRIKTPTQVQGLTNVVAVAAGWGHTLALKSDGTVWAWGLAPGGLGDGITRESKVPLLVSALTSIVAIATGGSSCSAALKSDGTVWTWGCNFLGQLGNGRTVNSSVPVQVSGLTNVAAISIGSQFLAALESDGTVWTWGANQVGQLGNNSTTGSLVPVRVSGLTDVAAIAAGSAHAVVLKSDGTVWAWGINGTGQLGNKSSHASYVPVQVPGPSGQGFLNLGGAAPKTTAQAGVGPQSMPVVHSVAPQTVDGAACRRDFVLKGAGFAKGMVVQVAWAEPGGAEAGRRNLEASQIEVFDSSNATISIITQEDANDWSVHVGNDAASISKPVVFHVTAKEAGEVIGTFGGVDAVSHGQDTMQTSGPLSYQCVHYAKQYYRKNYSDVSDVDSKWESAGAFWNKSKYKTLTKRENRSTSIAPKPGDMIFFSTGHKEGHVAVVKEVTADRVEIIQQNIARNTAFAALPISVDSVTGLVTVGSTMTIDGFGCTKTFPVLGWLSPSPPASAANTTR